MAQPEDPRFNLRLTADLKKRLALAAIDNDRSMNAEILHRLEHSFDTPNELRPLLALNDKDRARAIELLREVSELIEKARQR